MIYAENLEKTSTPAVLDSGFRAASRGHLDMQKVLRAKVKGFFGEEEKCARPAQTTRNRLYVDLVSAKD